MVIDLLSQAGRDIAELDAALDRLDRGAYGACARCGRAIAADRLAAHPTARNCVACEEPVTLGGA